MFLITSGAYLNSEFTAEFGRLPPAFLPVGNKRLYQWQVPGALGLDGRIVLSIPQDFEIPEIDKDIIAEINIEIVRVPPGLSLGASIVYCINVCRAHNEPIRILHGDTLCGDLRKVDHDRVMVASTAEFYNWAEFRVEDDGRTRFVEGLPTGRNPRHVLCGYFALQDAALLVQCISEADYSFVAGLDAYSAIRNIETRIAEEWYDFGHVQLYYQSKSRMTTERAFNSLTATKRWVTKSSSDQHKIEAEASWYENLPRDLAFYTPRYLGREVDPAGNVSYKMEYLYLSTLSELYVFGDLPTYVWGYVLGKCGEFLTIAKEFKADGAVPLATQNGYLEKTLGRLETFGRAHNLSIDAPTTYGLKKLPSLRRIAEICASAIPDATPGDMSIWHGDFCFSNIFYDFRAHQVRTIDPRGRSVEGDISIYGDLRYDISKLAHCLIGRYDFIVPGFFKLSRPNELSFQLTLPQSRMLTEIEDEFARMRIGGYNAGDPWVLAMTITLFLSMLPLHDDDPRRQFGLLANALRLFVKLEQA